MITSYDTDISDEQLRAIGRVTVNWCLLEYVVGRVVAEMLSITQKQGRILTQPLRIMQKLEVLQLLSELNAWPESERTELNKVVQTIDHARQKRNLIAHGLWVEDADGCHYLVQYGGNKKNRLSGSLERMTIADIDAIAQSVAFALRDFDAWWLSRRTVFTAT